MKENLISLDTSKLANENGYRPNRDDFYYSEENNFQSPLINYNPQDSILFEIYAAPTQSNLQKWLRENHRIYIWIIFNANDKYSTHFRGIDVRGYHWTHVLKDENSVKCAFFNTYEEALEAGLERGLIAIKKLQNNEESM